MQLVLAGIKHAVRVSGIFSMDSEQTAFIKCVAKFAILDDLRDLKQKHIPYLLLLFGTFQFRTFDPTKILTASFAYLTLHTLMETTSTMHGLKCSVVLVDWSACTYIVCNLQKKLQK